MYVSNLLTSADRRVIVTAVQPGHILRGPEIERLLDLHYWEAFMSLRRVSWCAVFALSVAMVGTAEANTIDVRIDAYIDGADDLALGGDYAYWYHGTYLRPGVPTVYNNTVPTWITTSVNGGSPTSFKWIPEWPNNVNDQPQWSAVYHGLSPVLPSGPMQVQLVDWWSDQYRQDCYVALNQQPSLLNNWQIVLGFNDNACGGAEWYHAIVRIDTGSAPVPVPSTIVALSSLGVVGMVAAIRRRRRRVA